jgi:hypothetical protein
MDSRNPSREAEAEIRKSWTCWSFTERYSLVAEFSSLRHGTLPIPRWVYWGCQFNAGPHPAKHGAKIIRLFLPMRQKRGYNWRLGDSARKPAG